MSQSGSSGWSISWFQYFEATRSISTPPGWDASPMQGYSPFIHLGGARHCEGYR